MGKLNRFVGTSNRKETSLMATYHDGCMTNYVSKLKPVWKLNQNKGDVRSTHCCYRGAVRFSNNRNRNLTAVQL